MSFGPPQPDAELVARASGGDDRAFAELVKRHERRVYNLAFRMLGREEDARDATQDTFLSCYRRLSSFRGEAAFTTWLHRIAVNASYDILRRRKGTTLGQDELPEPPPSPDHGDRTAAAVDVQRAPMRVAVEYRAVLVLCDLQGHAYDEVAEMLDVPLGTVKSRLHRGRIALGRVLGVVTRVSRRHRRAVGNRTRPNHRRSPSRHEPTTRPFTRPTLDPSDGAAAGADAGRVPVRMPLEHPDELLAAYTDGSASPSEAAVVEAHLPGCEQCRAEIRIARGATWR